MSGASTLANAAINLGALRDAVRKEMIDVLDGV